MSSVTGIDPAMICRALKQLEDRGLILTVRDSADRRARQVLLTLSGRPACMKMSFRSCATARRHC